MAGRERGCDIRTVAREKEKQPARKTEISGAKERREDRAERWQRAEDRQREGNGLKRAERVTQTTRSPRTFGERGSAASEEDSSRDGRSRGGSGGVWRVQLRVGRRSVCQSFVWTSRLTRLIVLPALPLVSANTREVFGGIESDGGTRGAG